MARFFSEIGADGRKAFMEQYLMLRGAVLEALGDQFEDL